MSGEPVYLKVFRYDPESDSAPRYEDFEVPWREGLLLLPGLRYVRDNLDETLAFRDYCCGCSWCMSCVMTVNGKGRRTCSRLITPGERILVEPMRGFPVIRDLAVDFGITITTSQGTFRKMAGTLLRRSDKAADPDERPTPPGLDEP
jgi:succinate dehydrogenase/fumarate reductase-like Fe-S protein